MFHSREVLFVRAREREGRVAGEASEWLSESVVADTNSQRGGFKSRDVELVRALIDAGADVKAKSGGGYTALDTAKQWGRPEIVELLIKNVAKAEGK